MLITGSSHAMAGIQYNFAQFDLAAKRISDPETMADVSDIVAMKQAEVGIKANAAVLKKANELSGVYLDLLL